MKLYRNWIINEVARAGEHTNERTYVRTYVLTYIRTGQTLYPLHNFVVRGDNKGLSFTLLDVYMTSVICDLIESVSDGFITYSCPLLFKIYARPKFHGFSPYSF